MQVSGQAQTKQHCVVQHTICACQLPPVGILDICQWIIEPTTDQVCGLSEATQLRQHNKATLGYLSRPALTACAQKLALIWASPL